MKLPPHRKTSSLCPPTDVDPRGADWIRVWYEVIRALPSAKGCDADLAVLPSPIPDGVGRAVHGEIFNHAGRLRLTCAIEKNPCEAIGTLLHEVGHFAQNRRHGREHGYSFRRAFVALAAELLGEVPVVDSAADTHARAARYRRVFKRLSMAEALDSAIVDKVAETMPWVHVDTRRDRIEAWVGGVRHLVPISTIR